MEDIKKIVSKNRRILTALGMLALVVLIFWTVNSPAIVGTSAAQRQLPVYSVQREDKVVAISFDAAWGNEDTQTLIDILKKYRINATFFVVGNWAEKYPESVKALAEAGNEVMNHSSSHAHFSQLSTEEILEDLRACNEKIAALTGVSPSLFRCPYGEYDDHVIEAVRSMGMTPIQWDVETKQTEENADMTEPRSGRPGLCRGTDYIFSRASSSACTRSLFSQGAPTSSLPI